MDPRNVNELFIGPDTRGVWLVTTTSSQYLFDFDAMTTTRYPRVDNEDERGQLRRDGETLPLLLIRHIAVGERFTMFIQVRTDPNPTLRRPTEVISIERVEAVPAVADDAIEHP
jgi:hypothetical protein